MPRKSDALLQFDALTIEGGLLPPEWLGKVAALEVASQTPGDYGVPKGLELRDEITRSWRIAEALWSEYAPSREHKKDGAAASTNAFFTRLLTQVFGFVDLVPGGDRTIHERVFRIQIEALAGQVPVVVGVPGEELDASVSRHGDGTRRRSAWGALQEYLNASDTALWGVATNGSTLRIGRDNNTLTRPAWIEADLERIFAEDRFPDFSVLWLLLHASRFGRADGHAEDSPLETWREAAREAGTRARDHLRDGVEAALRSLGAGFLSHPDNIALRQALAGGEIDAAEYFNELLRLVYRMIFLLTIEEREILHPADADADTRALYAQGYGMRRLRDRAVRRSQYDRHTDLWASIRPVFAALGRKGGEPALGLPELGGLFETHQCAHLDDTSIENRALLEAAFRLAWLRDDAGLTRVNWKDMGPEELGSIYESLLELVPRIGADARTFTFAGEAESAGNARKLTGSYYTPDSLVQQLLDTALEPVLQQRLAESQDDAEAALLGISVIDPACGSGHFLLAAARRLATHLGTIRSSGTPGAREYRLALRDVVTHCIHGVDRNPMALELARMSLWLETFTPERALGFLDHHLVLGDALLGLIDFGALGDGIPDDAFKRLTGDDKHVAKTLKKINSGARKALEQARKNRNFSLPLGTQDLGAAYAQLDALDDAVIDNVQAKQRAHEELRTQARNSRIALAADVFVGAFLTPKRLRAGESALSDARTAALFPHTGTMRDVLEGIVDADAVAVARARAVCREARVLHWPLAFPQVFARGGFDVVVGNPPWERIKLQEEEYFAVHFAPIALAANKADREKAIEALSADDVTRPVYDDFLNAKQKAEALGAFFHSNARFELAGGGDVNTYHLFVETTSSLLSLHGAAGLIVPSGIASETTTAKLFADVCASKRLWSFFEFTNEGFFPTAGQGHMLRFALMTIGGARRVCGEPLFMFQGQSLAELDNPNRTFRAAFEELLLVNPLTGTMPIFRTKWDAELTTRSYRVPILSAGEQHKGWDIQYLAMFHMSNDSHLFLRRDRIVSHDGNHGSVSGETRAAPLYEAKMVHLYNHRHADYSAVNPNDRPHRLPKLTVEQLRNPTRLAIPHYWVPQEHVDARLNARSWTADWLLGWRDVTDARASARTLIPCVIPRVGVSDKFPLILTQARGRVVAALVANLSSLPCDYIVRQKVSGLGLKQYMMDQVPVVPPEWYSESDIDFLVPRVLELTYTAQDLAGWAAELGCFGEPFTWDDERRALAQAEIDVFFAKAYGWSETEMRYVLRPDDVLGMEAGAETFAVLERSETKRFGEYRTRRLILDAWNSINPDAAQALPATA